MVFPPNPRNISSHRLKMPLEFPEAQVFEVLIAPVRVGETFTCRTGTVTKLSE